MAVSSSANAHTPEATIDDAHGTHVRQRRKMKIGSTDVTWMWQYFTVHFAPQHIRATTHSDP